MHETRSDPDLFHILRQNTLHAVPRKNSLRRRRTVRQSLRAQSLGSCTESPQVMM